MSDRPLALVVTAPGINCDEELCEAFTLAGADARRVHVNRLAASPGMLDEAELIGLPGGFSYGDAVAAGRIAAQVIRSHLWEGLLRAVERGAPMIAPCNGFQIAVQAGLLPGPEAGEAWPTTPASSEVALVDNESARFIDRWVRVEYPAETVCVWTRGLEPEPDASLLPIAHGEGRFVSGGRLDDLERAGRIAVRYASDDDPNGSEGHVAGICDASGLILGLMPHPERYTRWTQHPYWTRLDESDRRGDPPGLAMFRNAVSWVTAGRPATVSA
ncbi:MAG: phosphoribosylformylglycinamidine synthase subunit PurQ [Phycisphaerales bacterium]|nr:phosphoribosylformylglycinamidine synthase subunit PurQ [Phycisphaerales bacterium]